MEKIAFYRKYRPQNFDHLVGQDHVRQTLLNALREKRTVHAYIFAGPRGTGKTSTARLIAKALNCIALTEKMEPCNECDLCIGINEGRLIDLVEIDAASNRGIDEMRDLIEKINFAPTRAKNKIYIIDEAHMLTKEAFNALLKTLEEPPPYVYFILCTTEPHKIPETIISRCQRFDFKRIDSRTIMARLSYIAQLEKIEVEDKAIEAIAKNAEGGLRDAIGLMEQLMIDKKLTFERVKEMLGISGNENIDEFYKFLETGDASNALQFIQTLYKEGYDLPQFSRELLEVLREKLIAAVSENKTDAINRLMAMTDFFQNALDKFKNAVIPQLPLEIAVIELCGYKKEFAAAGAQTTAEPTVAAKKIESKKAAAAVPDESSCELVELNITNINARWPRIVEHLKTPTLKQSFRNSRPSALKGNTLTLEFKSRFYMDEMMTVAHLAEMEKAFYDIFNKKVRIKGVLQKIEIAPVITVEAPAEAPTKTGAQGVAEFFGGEVVEE
ncbi:DNA polymerase III subunit gamma/tau [Candidatus Peregrinibacteria bacterium]|nr:DNA polymerase III subunit gamma/tau [Candidatus Peregrinibacteria bacterium]